MGTVSEKPHRIHQGKNVKRFREMLGLKQEALAYELGEEWNQKRISMLEAKEEIEAEILSQVAKALRIPEDAIRNLDEEKVVTIIANNFNDTSMLNAVNYNPIFNPMEKWLEVLDENRKLYERLLTSEKEKFELLKGKNQDL